MVEWRVIPGFEKYEVSDSGLVRRSVEGQGTHRGRLLRPRPDRQGYLRLHLGQWSGEQYVHKLVALAFLGPRPRGKEVDHRNADKTDNCASNLQYLRHRGHRRKTARETVMRMMIAACRPHDPRIVARASRLRVALDPEPADLPLFTTLRRRWPTVWKVMRVRATG